MTRDVLSKSLYALVGLTKLHGLDAEPDAYSLVGFLGFVTALSAVAFALVRTPVPKSVPSMIWLLLQVVSICKEYDESGFARESPGAILAATAFGMILYLVFKRTGVNGSDSE